MLFRSNSKGRPLLVIIIKDKTTLTVCARTVARAAPVAAILNTPTNIKSATIFTIHAISTVIRGVFESPRPLNTPPITLYAIIKTKPEQQILK